MGVYKDNVTTEVLLAASAAGDETASEAIFMRFSPAVLRVAVALLRDRLDAEEVLQDTFVYAFRNLTRFDASKSAFQTWLLTIAISRCRNKRRRKWLPSIPLQWFQKEESSGGRTVRAVEDWLAIRGVRRELWAAVWTLSPSLREAVVLRYVGGLTYGEIAATVGCGGKAAESRVRTGLAALRNRFAYKGLETDDWLATIAEPGA
jgi:RNA polymerase sigma factor (sigma-70 family)